MEETNDKVLSEVLKNNDEDTSETVTNDILYNLLEPLSVNDDSYLHVVSVDNVPKFYVKDEESAAEKMWEVSRKLSATQFFAGYRTSILKVKENEISIYGNYRFFLISYDVLLHSISYSKVEECTIN